LAGYFDPKTRRYRKHKSPYIAIGFSDIWAIKNSMTKYFEVKSKTGVQSADQKEFERNLKIHGHDYYLVRSVDEVRAIIQAAERDNKHKASIDLKQYEDCYGQA
jgi:hypothetical protein